MCVCVGVLCLVVLSSAWLCPTSYIGHLTTWCNLQVCRNLDLHVAGVYPGAVGWRGSQSFTGRLRPGFCPPPWGWPDFCHMLAQLFFCSFAQHHCNFRKTLAKVPDAVGTVQPAGRGSQYFTVKYLYFFVHTVFYSLYFVL